MQKTAVVVDDSRVARTVLKRLEAALLPVKQQLHNQTANENQITQQLTNQVTKLHRMLLVLAVIVFILAAVIIL